MAKRRNTETYEQRNERLAKHLQDRMERTSAQDAALDLAVKQSINLHGA